MADHHEIYKKNADIYDNLVSHEDYSGNILAEIERLSPLSGKDVVEMGAGTGRITGILAPAVNSIKAFDISQHMLDFGIEKLNKLNLSNFSFAVADNREIPLPDNCADLAVSGWSIGYFASWKNEKWKKDTHKAVDEMERMLRTGGTAIIIETLGTGHETPVEPSSELSEYYSYLENELGFSRSWIRTDYKFSSVEDAEKTVRTFFGDELGNYFKNNNTAILPECTGFWAKMI
ncbi:MAG: class I SAM-dependent methyltransferase [Spirochaetia bacterium]|jgi:ubiquinone/menaquinone biosynthesis C-methylase UbiE|nr:class I SAM-dependent methyltransferase [Spirochaetia bacterium]